MAIKANTLRPGLLVSLKTSIQGNVQYNKRVIEREHIVNGQEKAKWETERVVFDPAELDAAQIARGKATNLIRRVCAHSAFGLLCPDAAEASLEAAIIESRRIVDEFNATARISHLGVYVITGRIAQDDVEAIRAIKSEIRDLVDTMKEGVKNLDAKSIREAAGKARSVAMMLSPEAEARVKLAIETARTAARQIVKAGEEAAGKVDTTAIKKLTDLRTSFLDLDDAKEMARPKAEGRAVDLEPKSAKPTRYRLKASSSKAKAKTKRT